MIAAILPVPDTNWIMVAKLNTDEVFSEIADRGINILLFTILSILLTLSIAFFGFNHRRRLLYQSLYETEKEKREVQEEIRTTLYSIGDGVIATDIEGRITRLNPVAEQLTGWSEQESIGRPLNEVFSVKSETTGLKVANPVERVLREGIVVGLANQTLLVARDGREYPIADSGAPIRSESGKIIGTVLVFRDQTKEREERRETALLDYAIENSLNEIYLFDAKSLKFRFANESALINLGYSLDQMRSMTPLDIKPEFTPEAFDAAIEPLRQGRTEKLVFETVYRRLNGSLYPVLVNLQLFHYANDEVFFAVIQDTSAIKQAQEEIRALNQELEQRVRERTAQLETANKELEAFAYSISHDLRAPLRTVYGFSELLDSEYKGKLDEQGRHYLERIELASRHMGELIEDLLKLSRVTRQETSRQPINLSVLAQEIAVELKAQAPERSVEFRIASDLGVNADRNLMQIALFNLLGNAFKFTGEKDHAIIEFGMNEENGEKVFFVRDNGVGFDMAYADKLFAPFQRLHDAKDFPGTGIGLVIIPDDGPQRQMQ